MNIKDDLCRVFCDGIQVHSVPAGLAIGTPFLKPDGDRIGFYLVQSDNQWRIEDDGATVPLLIASGVDVESGERAAEFNGMLAEHRATYDVDSGEITTPWVFPHEIPMAALKFSSLLLRMSSLSMLHPDKVRRTFREDAIAALKLSFEGKITIEEDSPVANLIPDFQADVILRNGTGAPLAIFVATGDNRVYEAMLARSLAKNLNLDVRVAALLESERPPTVSIKVQQRARNYLDAAPSFKGDEHGAMNKFAEMVGYQPSAIIH